MKRKIVMLGESAVGKTCFVDRLQSDAFSNAHVPTIGAQYILYTTEINGVQMNLEIWDTAGQEVFRSLVGFYARDTQGAFIVFDVSNKKSFEALPDWIEFIYSESQDANIIIIANKIDLPDREVTQEDINEFLRSRPDIKVFETSAKTGQGIKDAFDEMACSLVPEQQEPPPPPVVVVEQKSEEKKTKKGCC